MICKKCGKEYADDMLRCLWCDTPNEQHVTPESPEKFEFKDSIFEERLEQVVLGKLGNEEYKALSSNEKHQEKMRKHPAGYFMWSAAILGAGLLSTIIVPIYVAILHSPFLNMVIHWH